MELGPAFEYVESQKEKFIANLAESVAIKSVSAWPETRAEIVRMLDWTCKRLQDLGAASAEIVPIGDPAVDDPPLPGVLFAKFNAGIEGRPTLLIYGHLDVQPAAKSDGWTHPPFELTRDGGKLYGRGSTDDKGPVLGWLHAIETFKQCNMPLPVNLHIIFEGMEESGSEGLDDLLLKSQTGKDFLAPVDVVCISDNYWLGTKKPCLTYGLRGISYFFVEVTCANQDLHSGIFGGTVREAMTDLVHIMSTLLTKDGKIAVDGIYNSVAKLTNDELARYAAIAFDVDEYKAYVGAERLLVSDEDKVKTLMARWREPSLSLHGIEGAFYEPGSKTVIPRKVVGKFSIRLVPHQTPDEVERLVIAHINREWKALGSSNKLHVCQSGNGGKPWLANTDHDNFVAAKRATKMVYNVEPDMIREGGSIPVTLTLQEATGKNVLLLPMGAADDGAHSQNEKIDEHNYIQGTKLFIAYLAELGQLMGAKQK